jgi:DNA adenine methylase
MKLDVPPKLTRAPGPQYASPLRYPGGKGRLGPWLSEVLAVNGLTGGWYIEPYAGGAGAALFLLIKGHVSHIVINDADPVIYAFWESVVHNAEAFEQLVWDTPVTMETRAEMIARLDAPALYSTLELGFAAFFLNRTSRSGILRGGVIGGKEQTGPYKLDARYQREDLVARIRAIAERKTQITVVGMDALELLVTIGPGLPEKCLAYLDPPYYVKGSQLYRNHYHHEDHETIAHFASITSLPMLITYDDCPEIRKLYHGMEMTKFSLVYSTHTGRPQASEILIRANVEVRSTPRLTRGGTISAPGTNARGF